MTIYCLKVVIGHPSYKRPFVAVTVKHFKTKEEANTALNEIKLEYIRDNELFADIEEEEEVSDAKQVEEQDAAKTENKEETDNKYISVEEFDKMLDGFDLYERIYSDFGMGQPPFDAEIVEVNLE